MNLNIDYTAEYIPYSQPPEGYLPRIAWAEVQMKAGLKQQRCGFCSLWKFPQELVGGVMVTRAITSRGRKVNVLWHVCEQCAKKETVRAQIEGKLH